MTQNKPLTKAAKEKYCNELARYLCEFEGDDKNVTKRAGYKEQLMLSGDTKRKILVTYERVRDTIIFDD